MTRSHRFKRSGIMSVMLLVGLVLAGPSTVAGASPNNGGKSAEHRDDTAAAKAQDERARAAHKDATAAEAAASTEPQPASNADFSGNGANDTGAYDSTRDGSPSLNGNGDGAAVGRPCAGCAGKADNKNPPGQFPDGSDANKGYECDGNSGIGRTNPAHTGCVTATDLPDVPETPLDVLGVTFTRTSPAVAAAAVTPATASLPATGASSGLTTLALSGLAMILLGLLLRTHRRTGAYTKA